VPSKKRNFEESEKIKILGMNSLMAHIRPRFLQNFGDEFFDGTYTAAYLVDMGVVAALGRVGIHRQTSSGSSSTPQAGLGR
jgi:hypothetical protein